MEFKIISDICRAETFAQGKGIREIKRLEKQYGQARWRKRKGFATVAFTNGITADAELHWYEAQGIGKREMKIKRI